MANPILRAIGFVCVAGLGGASASVQAQQLGCWEGSGSGWVCRMAAATGCADAGDCSAEEVCVAHACVSPGTCAPCFFSGQPPGFNVPDFFGDGSRASGGVVYASCGARYPLEQITAVEDAAANLCFRSPTGAFVGWRAGDCDGDGTPNSREGDPESLCPHAVTGTDGSSIQGLLFTSEGSGRTQVLPGLYFELAVGATPHIRGLSCEDGTPCPRDYRCVQLWQPRDSPTHGICTEFTDPVPWDNSCLGPMTPPACEEFVDATGGFGLANCDGDEFVNDRDDAVCERASSSPADAGPADAGPADAGPADAGSADAGPADAGPDVSERDAGTPPGPRFRGGTCACAAPRSGTRAPVGWLWGLGMLAALRPRWRSTR